VSEITRHLTTVAEVGRRFLPVRIEVVGAEGEEGEVRVEPAPGDSLDRAPGLAEAATPSPGP
jgi:hypothetical protein